MYSAAHTACMNYFPSCSKIASFCFWIFKGTCVPFGRGKSTKWTPNRDTTFLSKNFNDFHYFCQFFAIQLKELVQTVKIR